MKLNERFYLDKANHYIIAFIARNLIGQLSETVPAITALINGNAKIMKKGWRLRDLSATSVFPVRCLLAPRRMTKNLFALSLLCFSVYKPGALKRTVA